MCTFVLPNMLAHNDFIFCGEENTLYGNPSQTQRGRRSRCKRTAKAIEQAIRHLAWRSRAWAGIGSPPSAWIGTYRRAPCIRWPQLLRSHLRATGLALEFVTLFAARTGTCARTGAARQRTRRVPASHNPSGHTHGLASVASVHATAVTSGATLGGTRCTVHGTLCVGMRGARTADFTWCDRARNVRTVRGTLRDNLLCWPGSGEDPHGIAANRVLACRACTSWMRGSRPVRR